MKRTLRRGAFVRTMKIRACGWGGFNMLEKLKGVRHLELLLALLALAACVLLSGRFSSGEAPLERRMAETLSRVEGAGRVSVVLRCGEDGAAQGAVIVAEGADDLRVMLSLQRAAQSLLGVETARIEVLPMEGGQS